MDTTIRQVRVGASVAIERPRIGFVARMVALAAGVLMAMNVAPHSAAAADKEQVLYSFCSQAGCADGQYPDAGLIMDASGNLYGTTRNGGNASDAGTVFELTFNNGQWTESVLYSFCAQPNCADGYNPNAGLIMDASGNLYGTTTGGGGGSLGTVFKLTPNATKTAWTYTGLYSFCAQTNCTDGSYPFACLTMDAAGNLYGVTTYGGRYSALFCPQEPVGYAGCGTVFKLTPKSTPPWTETVLYRFCAQPSCSDGITPAGLILDASGTLYGTTTAGGNGSGTVFELTPNAAKTAWTHKVLYTFCAQPYCSDGAGPDAGLIMDKSGNLYGTTYYGGSSSGRGNGLSGKVFELTPNAGKTAWTYNVLYNFCSQSNCADGDGPDGGLIMDTSGNLYGTTLRGGSGYSQSQCPPNSAPYACGTAFELTPPAKGKTAWTETVLYSLCSQSNCTDGEQPLAGLIMDAAGNFYGTTTEGGANGGPYGALFKLTPPSYSLSVSVAGNGSGTVTSKPSGVNCPGSCTASFAADTTVTLAAAARTGSIFGGWGGACKSFGAQSTCTVKMSARQSVTASFSPAHSLSVFLAGSGAGTVTSQPAGVHCPSSCNASFASGTAVKLSADARSGSVFDGWGGACSSFGAASTCTVTMSAGENVTAGFSDASYPLAVTVAGAAGGGAVTSDPSGIKCSSGTCSANFASGTTVTLTANPNTGYVFEGWTGNGACWNTSTCALTMYSAESVTVNFAPVAPRPASAAP